MNVIYIADGCNTYEVLQINGGAWYKLWEWNKEFMGVKLGIIGDSYIHEDLHFLHFLQDFSNSHKNYNSSVIFCMNKHKVRYFLHIIESMDYNQSCRNCL